MVRIVTIEIQRVKIVTDYCIKKIDCLTCDIAVGYNKHVGGNVHL